MQSKESETSAVRSQMRNRIALATGFLVLAVAAGLLPGTQRWEYLIFAPKDAELDYELNKLGASGWEIVSARRATSATGNRASYELIMKRQKSPMHFAENAMQAFKDWIRPQSATGSATQTSAPKSGQALPSYLPAYPKPDSPLAQRTLRACVDGRVHALEHGDWVIFRLGGSTLPCRPE